MQTVTKTGIWISCLLTAGMYMQPVQAQKEKNEFTIEGTIKDIPNPPAVVYLIHYMNDPRETDSARVINGKYVFKSSTEEVNSVRISSIYFDNVVRPSRPHTPGMLNAENIVTVYVNKGAKIKIVSTGTMKNAVITGSQADIDFHDANNLSERFGDTLRKTYLMAKETNNQVLMSTILTETNLLKMGTYMKEGYISYLRKKPASPVNMFLLRQLIPWKEEAGWMEKLDVLYKNLPAASRTSNEGKATGELLAAELNIAPGHKAMDFSQANTSGQPVSLSSFKGKYVLLLFWSSIDDKGVAMLPVVNKACETFGSKGLMALSVSLDTDKNSWLQAIKEKQVENITNVSDLKGNENKAARLYGIKKLPRNLLIDPNGIIVASDLDQNSIGKTLTSIFE